MVRYMFDSVTASDIPSDATMVAGYVNGTYRWSTADWNRFPRAIKVRIATRGHINDGHVLDVEPGATAPNDAPPWVLARRAAGIDPTVYCNQLNGWQDVRRAFRNAGVSEPHYWVARYDNDPSIPAGAVAKQFANPVVHRRGHFDLSVVADYWPGVDEEHNMADMETIIAHMASRLYQALQGHHSINSNDPGGVGDTDLVAPANEALWLVRLLDDTGWRLHSFLQLRDRTAGGTDGVAGAEDLPFVIAFKKLCTDVADLQNAVSGMRSDLDRFLSAGVQLEGEGTITVRPRTTG